MIGPELASFLQQGIGIHIGTRNEQLQPSGGRAAAVVVEADGEHVEVFVPELAMARLKGDLESNGQAALSFGRPEDERACQVKGVVAGIRRAAETERAIVEQQWDGYQRQLGLIGVPRAVMAAWSNWPAFVVRIRVTAVFEQTPGPQAGTRIR